MSLPSDQQQNRRTVRAGDRERRSRLVFLAALTIGACVLLTGCDGVTAANRAQDPVLRRAAIALYPARNVAQEPDAVVFFLGNDAGFWAPHRELAAALRYRGIAVAGLDITSVLAALPEADSLRGTAWLAQLLPLIERSRRELGAGRAPVIIAGHSLGAEIALWTAAYGRPAGVVGVLLLSPGSRSHLRVTLSDRMMTGEPDGPGSFSVADAMRALPANEIVSIVRGSQDKYAFADSGLRAAGGDRVRVFGVPFSGHSLYSLTLSFPAVSHAIDWILNQPPLPVARTVAKF